MRILIAGTTYYPGLNGMAIFMTNLAEGLAGRGHDVTVLFPESHTFSRKRNGAQLEAVGSISLGFLNAEAYLPVFMREKTHGVFDSFRPEILHVHDHYPLSVVALREAKRRHVRILGTNHFGPGSVDHYFPGAALMKPLLDRLLWDWMVRFYRQVDYVVAPSATQVSVLRAQGLPMHIPASAISCGTDLKRFHPDASTDRAAARALYGLDPMRTVFLYVGRVVREKRIDVLLQAMHMLPRDDVQLAIAGQGGEFNELRRLADALDLGDRAHFIGTVRNEELNQLLNCADVFALAGEAESLSIASLEAMACGLPVLLADAFALPELVTQGVNGYLFKSGDAEDAAHYMEVLIGQQGEWKKMGLAGIEKVKAHTLENTLDRYESIYRELLTKVGANLIPAAPV
jgi:glycosyltransferase involved in cell wall biosynthesis